MSVVSEWLRLIAGSRSRLGEWLEPALTRLFGEPELRREVLRLALPAAGEQLLSMMVSIVDTILVGHLSAAALAGVSLSTQWVFMTVTFFTAVSTGATALVARSVGAGDWEMANRTLRQALAIAVVIGLIGTALLLIFAEPALDLMGAEPQARAEGVTYLRLVSLVFVLQSVLFVSNACLRGAGDTRTAMVVMGVVNVLNIVVSWTAINGPFGLPRLGVAGSALGAVVGRGAGGLLVLVMLIRGRNGLKLVPRDWRPDMETVKRMLRVGLPTGVERLVIRFAMMIFLRAVAGLGTVAVAAHAVALRAESLSFMPGFGFAMAGTTLVGQGLGARQPKRAERSGYMTHRMATALMSVMGLMFILFPRFFVSLFTDDVAVIEMAITPLRIVGFVQPFLASSMVFPGSLRGAGDTMFPMYVSSASIWATRVPLTLLFAYALNLGLPGAWIAMGLDQAVRGTIFFLRFRSGQWKLKQV